MTTYPIQLDRIVTGERTIAGRKWEVADELLRAGEREWIIRRDVCDRAARDTETYRSERTAREAFATRMDGRKPRGASAGKPVTIRATNEERASWEAAASAAGENLTEWLRGAARLRMTGGAEAAVRLRARVDELEAALRDALTLLVAVADADRGRR